MTRDTSKVGSLLYHLVPGESGRTSVFVVEETISTLIEWRVEV